MEKLRFRKDGSGHRESHFTLRFRTLKTFHHTHQCVDFTFQFQSSLTPQGHCAVWFHRHRPPKRATNSADPERPLRQSAVPVLAHCSARQQVLHMKRGPRPALPFSQTAPALAVPSIIQCRHCAEDTALATLTDKTSYPSSESVHPPPLWTESRARPARAQS